MIIAHMRRTGFPIIKQLKYVQQINMKSEAFDLSTKNPEGKKSINQQTFKIRYYFGRKVTYNSQIKNETKLFKATNKKSQQPQIFPLNQFQTQMKIFQINKKSALQTNQNQNQIQNKSQNSQNQLLQPKKPKYQKQTQFYTFTDPQKDLQMYQGFLNIFNTHTKKAHQKLQKNQLKIIQLIIEQKREDLLAKFLTTNYRNRLANEETINEIVGYFVNKLSANNFIEQVLSSAAQASKFLQSITLITEFNEMSLFKSFSLKLQTKLNLSPQQPDYLIKILKSLPSKQSQYLFIYNYLIKQKQLPLYFMQSQFYGLNTDKQNMKFQNLGEIFYQVRKFVRRYFALYKKENLEEKNQEQVESKRLERQAKQIKEKGSLLQTNVQCFLKVLNYTSIRKQILIDGYQVDFVIDTNKTTNKKTQKITTILQVMGSYHYTSKNKLKARDLRKLIILSSKYRAAKYNVKIIHFSDYNKSQGHRNKMELIKHVLEKSGDKVNWDPENKGYNSGWQLKQTYDQFK